MSRGKQHIFTYGKKKLKCGCIRGQNHETVIDLPTEDVHSQDEGTLRRNQGHPQPQTSITIKDLVEAAYLHGLPVENLDTGELEPPRDISDVQWIIDDIEARINKAVIEARMDELSGYEAVVNSPVKEFREDAYNYFQSRMEALRDELAELKEGKE